MPRSEWTSIKYPSTALFASAELLAKIVESGANDPPVVPLILTCAAALEARLNDGFIGYANAAFPTGDAKQIADAYLSVRLQSKIDLIVPTLTEQQFIIKSGSKGYQQLKRLVRFRNEFLHAKSHHESSALYDGDSKRRVEEHYSRLSNSFMPHLVQLATVDDAMKCYAGIIALRTDFFVPLTSGRLVANDLIEPNERAAYTGEGIGPDKRLTR